MSIQQKYWCWFSAIIVLIGQELHAYADRLRCTWREDPSTTMVIGWDQVNGQNPVLYYDLADQGRNAVAYRLSKRPDRILPAKGMNNHFVRLSGLKPNTAYYFVIKDSEGVSNRYYFHTAPDQPSQRLSIIAGGDSRNHREARRAANQMVAKLRPHVVLFNGDMTVHDSSKEWIEWMDDWQRTISSDGRLTPVLVARGNHEVENKTLVDMFDLPHPGNYYALNLGGNLLRVYTLNTMIPAAGDQKIWLENDLKIHASTTTWRIAQYHHAIRPHTAAKTDKDDLYLAWADLFYQYGVRLIIESDSHVVKWTFPIKPDTGPNNDMGFVRDDENGTIYVGEGCWGAPLRDNDDDKSWTRASGSFNQFNWIWVDQHKIEVRTVMTDNAEQVGEVSKTNLFEPPVGITFWNPPGGDVIRIVNKKMPAPAHNPPAPPKERPTTPPTAPPTAVQETHDWDGNWDALPKLIVNPGTGRVRIDYELSTAADVVIVVQNAKKEEALKFEFPGQTAGAQSRLLDLLRLPAGKYLLVIQANRKAIKRYNLSKGP